MSIPFETIEAGLSAEDKKLVNAMAEELIAEEATLQSLRTSLNITQTDLAARLDRNQAQISKTEKQQDILVSTLRDFVQGLGGDLHIMVKLPERPMVELSDLGKVE